jgi:hypothetical protein
VESTQKKNRPGVASVAICRSLDEICIDDISAILSANKIEIFATVHNLGCIEALKFLNILRKLRSKQIGNSVFQGNREHIFWLLIS